jgi:ATP adenylyltransferase
MSERPLWAPWRLQYITGPKSGGCIFCAAGASHDDGAGRVVDRGQRTFTMLNAFPYASGHVMVSPYRHVGSLEDLDAEESCELMRLSQRAVAALRALMKPDGFNIGMNLGKVAGAGFADHLHLHVVPRWNGDSNFMPVIGDTRVVPQSLDATHALLRQAFSEIE